MAETGKTQQPLNPIPVDILFEILLRLPSKSLTKFVCVSKLWTSIINGQDFKSFRSSRKKQPRLLFAFINRLEALQENWFFFSKPTLVSTPLCSFEREPCPPSPLVTLWRARVDRRKGRISLKPKAPLEPKAVPVVVEEEPPDFLSSTVCDWKVRRYLKPCYVHGLISFLYAEVQVICNPSTGKSITLPTVPNNTEMIVRSFLGYDPVHAQYKVLCLTNVKRFCEHQVLTLGGTRAQGWRMIQCSTPHYYLGKNSVCIDGVLYYTASTSINEKETILVGFDLRSEILRIVSLFPEGIASSEETLIEYHGKIALVAKCSQKFTMWVLMDAEKQEWSKECIDFSVGGIRNYGDLEMLGVSDMGEFIFAPTKFEELLVVYFVNHKRNKIRRVELEGNTKYKFRDFDRVFTFLDYVESDMFI